MNYLILEYHYILYHKHLLKFNIIKLNKIIQTKSIVKIQLYT